MCDYVLHAVLHSELHVGYPQNNKLSNKAFSFQNLLFHHCTSLKAPKFALIEMQSKTCSLNNSISHNENGQTNSLL